MDKQDLAIEIYYELDTLRLMSRLCTFAIENEAKNVEIQHLDVIFRDIYKRSWQISELVEKLEKWEEESCRMD